MVTNNVDADMYNSVCGTKQAITHVQHNGMDLAIHLHTFILNVIMRWASIHFMTCYQYFEGCCSCS